MNRSFVIIGGLLAAIVQTSAIGYLVNDREQKWNTGKEILLAATVFKQRDLFRGYYSKLVFQIERTPKGSVETVGEVDEKYRGPAYLSLGLTDELGFAYPDRIFRNLPTNTAAPILKVSNLRYLQENYLFNIQNNGYFSSEARASDLQIKSLQTSFGVILSLQPDGTGIIKGVVIDGERIYDEPLF